MEYLSLAIAALFGSTLAAVTGFGGAAVLLPVLVHFFGVRDAIPILTIAQLVGNGSRVYFNFKEVNWQVTKYFAITAVPAALIGGLLFTKTKETILLKFLGFFLIGVVLWRWIKRGNIKKMPLNGFAGIGLVFSFLSALVGSVGPFIVPFFLSYGLVKGAFIGTEAMCTVVMHVFKLIAYNHGDILNLKSITVGLSMGPLMIFGSWIGKKIVAKIPEKIFVRIVEATLIISGVTFLLK